MKMLVFKDNLFISYFLFVGLAIFGGCGDGDEEPSGEPIDQSVLVGTWALETWGGQDLNEAILRPAIDAGNRKLIYWSSGRIVYAGGEVSGEFHFGDDGRWTYTYTVKFRLNPWVPYEVVREARKIANDLSYVDAGSYTLYSCDDSRWTSRDSFCRYEDYNFIVMTNDIGNTKLIGISNANWRLDGSKSLHRSKNATASYLTLIGYSKFFLGTMIFRKIN